jgi:hypothetical protein
VLQPIVIRQDIPASSAARAFDTIRLPPRPHYPQRLVRIVLLLCASLGVGPTLVPSTTQ